MEYLRKPDGSQAKKSAVIAPNQRTEVTPDAPSAGSIQRQQVLGRDLARLTTMQRHTRQQVAQPALQAANLERQEIQRLAAERADLQAQASALQRQFSPAALGGAVQRQQVQATTASPVRQPQSTADWVTVMRQQAEGIEGRYISAQENASFTQLQRQVSQTLVQRYRADRQAPEARQSEYAGHLVSLQRHALSSPVAQVFLSRIPQAERPALQRAVDEALQREQAEAQADSAARHLDSLQRHMAELDAQATQPVWQRIQERRGSGNPLPEAIQRHLEQGLNHDLSGVRIHDDSEADTLAKGVNATAFTSGKDIYFQSGKFNPNTQSGLELLAHEVTHTVQQSKGAVGKGIDPDSGLESEAREKGKKLAQVMPSPKSLLPPIPHKDGLHAPGVYSPQAAMKRAQDGAAGYFALKPLYDLQPQSVQRAARGEWSIQRDFSLNPLDWAKAGAEKLKEAAMSTVKAIPGYRELSVAFGRDLITGEGVESGSGALELLANWAPGPLKDIIKALQETNVIGKAWDWFKGELGKLNLGGILGEIKNAIFQLPPDVGAATRAVTSRIGGLKDLIVGSAKKIAEIALTVITAALGPVGKQLMEKLRGSGDVIIKILKNPGEFASNLLNAVTGGFKRFGSNAPKHLQNGLGIWLTGTSDLKFPPKLDLAGVFMLALTVAGITYQGMRARLASRLGPTGAAALNRAEMNLPELLPLKSGIEKAPELMGSRNTVGTEIVEGLKGEVMKSLVTAGIIKVASMLIPGGGFIQAIMGAFSAVQTLISQGQQIAQVIINGLSSIQAIAAGNIGGAVAFIDTALGASIPVILSFLSRFLGIGSLGGKVRAIITKVKARLQALEDKILGKITGLIQKVLEKTKLDSLNLATQQSSGQTKATQNRAAQVNTATSQRQATQNTEQSKVAQATRNRAAQNERANTDHANKAKAEHVSAAQANKNATDPAVRIKLADKANAAAKTKIDQQAKAAKTAADNDAKKVKAAADKGEKEAQALAKKHTKEGTDHADKDVKAAKALADKDAKGFPGADTRKAKAEADQVANKNKAKVKAEEIKTTGKAKTDAKTAKTKAEQAAKKAKADADSAAKKAKAKADKDAKAAKAKAKADAKRAKDKAAREAKKKSTKATTNKDQKSKLALAAGKNKKNVKDNKKPKKDETADDAKKRNQKLSDKEKQDKLDKAIKAITPVVKPLLRKGIQRGSLTNKLSGLRSRYDLTSLSIEGSGVFATVNPKGRISSVMSAAQALSQEAIRIVSEVSEKVNSARSVLQQRQKLNQQRSEQNRGYNLHRPIDLTDSNQLAVAGHIQDDMTYRRTGGRTYYRSGSYGLTHVQSPYAKQPILPSTTRLVIPSGETYREIGQTLLNLRSRIQAGKAFSDTQAEQQIMQALTLLNKGQPISRRLREHEGELVRINHLMHALESARGHSPSAFTMMTIDNIRSGRMSISEAFDGRPHAGGLYPPLTA